MYTTRSLWAAKGTSSRHNLSECNCSWSQLKSQALPRDLYCTYPTTISTKEGSVSREQLLRSCSVGSPMKYHSTTHPINSRMPFRMSTLLKDSHSSYHSWSHWYNYIHIVGIHLWKGYLTLELRSKGPLYEELVASFLGFTLEDLTYFKWNLRASMPQKNGKRSNQPWWQGPPTSYSCSSNRSDNTMPSPERSSNANIRHSMVYLTFSNAQAN